MPALFLSLILRNLFYHQLLLKLTQPVAKRPLTSFQQPNLSNSQPKPGGKEQNFKWESSCLEPLGLHWHGTRWTKIHRSVSCINRWRQGWERCENSSSAILYNVWSPRCPPTSVLHVGRKACQALTFCSTTGSLYKEKGSEILIISSSKLMRYNSFELFHFILFSNEFKHS